nr:formin-like protein 5 [Aegilops tauschii subsp. strangulata]
MRELSTLVDEHRTQGGRGQGHARTVAFGRDVPVLAAASPASASARERSRVMGRGYPFFLRAPDTPPPRRTDSAAARSQRHAAAAHRPQARSAHNRPPRPIPPPPRPPPARPAPPPTGVAPSSVLASATAPPSPATSPSGAGDLRRLALGHPRRPRAPPPPARWPPSPPPAPELHRCPSSPPSTSCAAVLRRRRRSIAGFTPPLASSTRSAPPQGAGERQGAAGAVDLTAGRWPAMRGDEDGPGRRRDARDGGGNDVRAGTGWGGARHGAANDGDGLWDGDGARATTATG